ncbi:GDCCVxC domain-containing (seleno)protein [Gemmatirosa kalamazoonensis]|uniref:GDCCVxC domain-containing (seleno)protein n=1 Tax=Gemmatirosa kalamazoonensis TaxID=861299 RepID=UPI00046D3184|nr:GDCCVxC domain-containing (seleno)protein [Gemmatirosa kalamazoonensis]
MTAPVLTSLLRCPACGHEESLDMPTDACVFFHACTGCGVVLRPRAGDCCVFCSYGSAPCPPVQLAGAGAGCCAQRSPPGSSSASA